MRVCACVRARAGVFQNKTKDKLGWKTPQKNRKRDLTVCSFVSLEQAGNEIKVHREISKIVISGPLRQAHFNSLSLFISKDHKCDHYIQESAAVIF